ncbi:MAG: hypothetical protein IJE78_05680 [Bacteroidaceae bacterium]|nr:hypothetical protein [Bacteroidaceae bacterium]
MAKTSKPTSLDYKKLIIDKELEKYRSKIKELEEEKSKVQSELLDLKLAANLEKLKELSKYSDIILRFMDHDRTSCSDEDPCNGLYTNCDGDPSYRCTKCALMEILSDPERYKEYCIDVDAHISFIRGEQ